MECGRPVGKIRLGSLVSFLGAHGLCVSCFALRQPVIWARAEATAFPFVKFNIETPNGTRRHERRVVWITNPPVMQSRRVSKLMGPDVGAFALLLERSIDNHGFAEVRIRSK